MVLKIGKPLVQNKTFYCFETSTKIMRYLPNRRQYAGLHVITSSNLYANQCLVPLQSQYFFNPIVQ